MIFKFRYAARGSHTHVRLFAGSSLGQLASVGTLTMLPAEWAELRAIVEQREQDPDGTPSLGDESLRTTSIRPGQIVIFQEDE